MHRLVLLFAVVLFVGCGPAQSQQAGGRAETILANLRFEYPQLADAPVSIDSLRASGIDGLDEGVLNVGGQAQPFLVTRDGSRLYLLATPAIDVSRTADQIAAAQTARDEAAGGEARARGADLAQKLSGLPVRGNPQAPVTIVEFSDFQCPYCRLAAGTVEQILQRYPDDVKVVYAHFPLGNHAWARPAAIAATCAAQQSDTAFWTLHDAYFGDQQATTPDNVMARSQAALAGAGIDMTRWTACTSSPTAAAEVDRQLALGEASGVSGTPGFFVNGRFVNGNQPIETFVAAVEAAKRDA